MQRDVILGAMSLCVLAGGLVACVDMEDAPAATLEPAQQSVAEVAHYAVAYFEGAFDPDTNELSLHVTEAAAPDTLRTQRAPLWRGVRSSNGAVDTVGIESRSGASTTIEACELPDTVVFQTLGVTCFSAEVTSYFTSTELVDVYAMITRIDPEVGFNGYGPPYGADVANVYPGPSAPTDAGGGLWYYGNIGPGETVSVPWFFQNAIGAWRFSGQIMAAFPERRDGDDDNGNGSIDEPPFADGETCLEASECYGGACVGGLCSSDSSACPPGVADPTCEPLLGVPTVGPLDYIYQYMPTNHRPTETWPAVNHEHHFLTGYYGAAWDNRTGGIVRLGALGDAQDMQSALGRENSLIDGMDAVSVIYEAGPAASPAEATSFTGAGGDTTHRARMIDGGRFMNFLIIPTVAYGSDPDLEGEVHIAGSARHVVLSQTVSGTSAASEEARIRFGGGLTAAYPNATWLATDRVLTLTDGAGDGWLFAVYDQAGQTTTLSFSAGEVVAETASDAPSTELSISLLIAPLSAVDDGLQALYVDPASAARVTTTLLTVDGTDVGASSVAPWDPMLGMFRATMGSIPDAGGPNPRPNYTANPQYHHWHGRHRVELESLIGDPVAVPIALWGSDKMSLYIVGGSPMLRDVNGEPTGLPIQVSKNWHDEPALNFYHFYTQPTLEAGSSTTLELTIASSMWGDVFAASHAQLSLIGYGQSGGHWDESAIGANGESITYDPDMNLRRAMIDDVRPLLVEARNQWDWTGNVGGGEFIRYATAAQPYWTRRLARVRSMYRATGPNLTDVTYSGVTSDGRIRVDAKTQLVASDDLVRNYITLNFNFLEDVEYDRLAFFQIAADKYADNLFSTFAYGNRDGVDTEAAVRTSTTPGYADVADRGIPLDGEEPWVFLFDNQKTVTGTTPREDLGNIGFVVREFEADIGGTIVTTPHMSLYQTFNGGDAQTSFELSLPYETGAAWCGTPCGGDINFIPAGSTVTATVEYLVPPAGDYYGPSQWLSLFAPAAGWSSADMMTELAREGALSVSVDTGALISTYPIVVAANAGATAAQITVEGGLGFTPISFTGLMRHDGWKLERLVGATWVTLDASSSPGANDWWQATLTPTPTLDPHVLGLATRRRCASSSTPVDPAVTRR